MAKTKSKNRKSPRRNRRASSRTVPQPAMHSRTEQAMRIIRSMHELSQVGEQIGKAPLFASVVLDTHHAMLWSRLNEALVSVANEDNVDTAAKPADRAKQFWNLLDTTVADLDDGSSAAEQTNIKKFLLHVAWHESMKLTKREQVSGPARSFFQFEAPRAKEAGLYAGQKKWLGKLAGASGEAEADLKASFDKLPDKDPPFPKDNLIHTLLKSVDLFGCYLARIAFKKTAEAIPTTNAKHAEYWYTHWKRTGGDENQLKKNFTDAANEVDKLLA